MAEAAASSTGTFHLQARITGHWPESARQLCQAMPRQQQQQAEEGGRRGRRAAGGAVLEWRFFFEVVLQDETGEIRALVADEVRRGGGRLCLLKLPHRLLLPLTCLQPDTSTQASA